MDINYQDSPLWKVAFKTQAPELELQAQMVAHAYAAFRERVKPLIAEIRKDLPNLTVHDITHVDALWWVASEIAGPAFEINPAEALVLGGAFLLHDAAHCLAAFPGGVAELKVLPEWNDFAFQLTGGTDELLPGTEQFQLVLFHVLRVMHPRQAKRLATLSWNPPGTSEQLALFPHDDLRLAYAEAIGRVAESHWAAPHSLECFREVRITPPVCLQPAPWNVDLLKIAVLLRTADAAHIDAQRAPRFLSALVKPAGVSLLHWQFQERLHQPKIDPDESRHDLLITGSPFPPAQQEAWWLAYDAARMIDNELRAADRLLMDAHRPRLAARSVGSSYNSEAFARNVPTQDWQPVDTSIKITDIKTMVERFGGEKLYGNNKRAAMRELLQNAVDAIHACRALGGLGEDEGEISVEIEKDATGLLLHVTDTGVGMSRFVLTDVLLDFGKSLWRSADLRGEWSGLAASGFEAIGQFGIGFFSVFMLGEQVQITTRRYETKEGEHAQWLLEFSAGAHKRPILREPRLAEKLKRHGTRISIRISPQTFENLCSQSGGWLSESRWTFAQSVAQLAPAIDINLLVSTPDRKRVRVVTANDWQTIPALQLLKRVDPVLYLNVDETRFGAWQHLSEIKTEHGALLGRLAINGDFSYRTGEVGIGVVNGIYAGPCHGVAGIVFTRPQGDLARHQAIPNLSLQQIQQWALEQKRLLGTHGQINKSNSVVLAACGVTYEGLILGELAGKPMTYEELMRKFAGSRELVCTREEVSYDADDGVLERDFRANFEPIASLFEADTHSAPKWLKSIANEKDLPEGWSISAALQSAVRAVIGDFEWRSSTLCVGTVDGTEITRYCQVPEARCLDGG